MTETFADQELSDSPGISPPSSPPDEGGTATPIGQSHSYLIAALVIAVVGILVTALVAVASVSAQDEARRDRFDNAGGVSTAIDSRFGQYAESVIGLRGLFAAVEVASRTEFDSYVEASSVMDRLPGTQATGFAPLVKRSDLAELETRVRGFGYPSFDVHPTAGNPDALPITYLTPLTNNDRAFGFDLAADAEGRKVVDEAARTGIPTAGGPLVVASKDGPARAFNLYAAVYEGGGVPGTDALRTTRFEGVTLAVIHPDAALEGAFGENPEVAVEIYDLGLVDEPGGPSRPSAANLLYDGDGEGLTAVEGSTGLHSSFEQGVAGRRWLVHVTPGPGFDEGIPGFPWTIVLAGLLITGLLSALILTFPRTRQDAAVLADEMTASLRQREQEVRRANQDIVRSNKELERYASIAAHDLQEPLRSLLAYASVLERRHGETLDPEALDYVHRMGRAAERMRSLVVDLLAYAKAESAERRIENVDLNAAVRIAADDLSLLMNETSATIRVAELPTVPGNRRELIGVFSNLLSNALKYRSDVPPEVLIVAHHRGSDWLIGVKDNGIGIAPAYHERIFELFRRLEKRESDQGTGLGLAICARTIQQHGGRIWVESEEGQGSTFWFTLPAEGPVDPVPAPPPQ